MIKVHPDRNWSRNLEKILHDILKATGEILEHDLMDSKWGHRVLDQIFREGKFAAPENSRNPSRKDHPS